MLFKPNPQYVSLMKEFRDMKGGTRNTKFFLCAENETPDQLRQRLNYIRNKLQKENRKVKYSIRTNWGAGISVSGKWLVGRASYGCEVCKYDRYRKNSNWSRYYLHDAIKGALKVYCKWCDEFEPLYEGDVSPLPLDCPLCYDDLVWTREYLLP